MSPRTIANKSSMLFLYAAVVVTLGGHLVKFGASWAELLTPNGIGGALLSVGGVVLAWASPQYKREGQARQWSGPPLPPPAALLALIALLLAAIAAAAISSPHLDRPAAAHRSPVVDAIRAATLSAYRPQETTK